MLLRLSVLVAGLVGWLTLSVSPAAAGNGDGYEPALPDEGTVVGGVQSGQPGGDGGTNAVDSGLAATGFRFELLVVAAALLLLGAALVVVTRRRRHS